MKFSLTSGSGDGDGMNGDWLGGGYGDGYGHNCGDGFESHFNRGDGTASNYGSDSGNGRGGNSKIIIHASYVFVDVGVHPLVSADEDVIVALRTAALKELTHIET